MVTGDRYRRNVSGKRSYRFAVIIMKNIIQLIVQTMAFVFVFSFVFSLMNYLFDWHLGGERARPDKIQNPERKLVDQVPLSLDCS